MPIKYISLLPRAHKNVSTGSQGKEQGQYKQAILNFFSHNLEKRVNLYFNYTFTLTFYTFRALLFSKMHYEKYIHTQLSTE